MVALPPLASTDCFFTKIYIPVCTTGGDFMLNRMLLLCLAVSRTCSVSQNLTATAGRLFRERSISFWALSQQPLTSYNLSILRGLLFLRLCTLFSSMSSSSPSLLLLLLEAHSTKLSLSPYACPKNPPAFYRLTLVVSNLS